jgi:hypothetical protein
MLVAPQASLTPPEYENASSARGKISESDIFPDGPRTSTFSSTIFGAGNETIGQMPERCLIE